MKSYLIYLVLFVFYFPAYAGDLNSKLETKDHFKWPNGALVAVSLSYDNTLNTQLDNVVPALNRYGFKGSFYLTLSSPVLMDRFSEWKAIAAQGHELGNHTIFHPCRRSLPGREWVSPDNDMDQRSASQMVSEIKTANTFLHAIDGKTERTFTSTCWDWLASGENFYDSVRPLFIGIKYSGGEEPEEMEDLDILKSRAWGPNGNTAAQLIAYAKKAAQKGSIAAFTFHDIGGEVNNVSKAAHDELLAYLAKNKDIYWVDTFINISRFVQKKVEQAEAANLKN
ncbi:MAG: polysaccharide deacetylase family protein [Enterobacterales bacterium]|nr:polysaccharide deacetylase family protein [Enterobacterales bacterium]